MLGDLTQVTGYCAVLMEKFIKSHMDLCCPGAIAAALVIVLLSVVFYFMKNRNVLPGPRGLPYLGLYPFLTHEKCHLQLEEYGKKYGDIFSFTSLGTLIVNLGSAKAIKQAHVIKSDCFAQRFDRFNILSYLMPTGVAFSNGELWMIQRKFFIQTFKEYGLTSLRDNTSEHIYESVSSIIKDIKSENGKPFNIIELLTDKCTVTMRKVLFGENGISDDQIRASLKAYAFALDGMVGVKMLTFGPVGRLLFKILPQYRSALTSHSVMCELLTEVVQKIESDMNVDHVTCVVEEFYKEKRIRRAKNDPTWKYFTDKALVESLTQIVGDGILGVAFFIGAFLDALVEHPEEQDKLYQELMEVVGPNRLPSPEDRNNLRYTNAFMNEVIRTSNFFPLFPSMECTKETTLGGYKIPKGSITMLNIWQAHHDPKAYENPYEFNPSRFLTADGKPKAESIVSFGFGKRSCVGESFTMQQSLLFLTSIVMNFRISDPYPGKKPELYLLTGEMELSLQPRNE